MGRGNQLNGKIEGGGEILSREQTLQILSEMARAGSVTAAMRSSERCVWIRAEKTMRTPSGRRRR